MEDQYESKKKKLFTCAMKGKWDNVIEMYKNDVTLHNAKITRSGQTALHIAVCDGKEHVVWQMVDDMSRTQPNEEELLKALRTPDRRKNTALHLAASMGNATVCGILAGIKYTLVDDRNNDGETPLFLAALHGREQAFLRLHSIRNPNMSTPTPPFDDNCRRNNGDTILHCAIKGNYFDLAFQIIHLYKDLANSVNEEGLSPLHVLASKPFAFRSGSRLGRMETLIYHCIHVEKLKAENQALEHHTSPSAAKDSGSNDYPPNYNTLWEFFRQLGKVVTGGLWNPDGQNKGLPKPVETDAEDPEARAGGSKVDRDQANPLFPANYRTCCHFVTFFYLLSIFVTRRTPGAWIAVEGSDWEASFNRCSSSSIIFRSSFL
ncbi:hypothetical protein K1719_018968 [Acacia pycnantha]|nr:hypothetical protein K1719_018968 [Acacia pycnantha]